VDKRVKQVKLCNPSLTRAIPELLRGDCSLQSDIQGHFTLFTRVLNTNSISIGSSVFAGLITVTDRPTDNGSRSVTIGSIYVRSTAIRPKIRPYFYRAAVMQVRYMLLRCVRPSVRPSVCPSVTLLLYRSGSSRHQAINVWLQWGTRLKPLHQKLSWKSYVVIFNWCSKCTRGKGKIRDLQLLELRFFAGSRFALAMHPPTHDLRTS